MKISLPFCRDDRPSAETMKFKGVLTWLHEVVTTLLSPVVQFGSFTLYEIDLAIPLEPVTPAVDLQISRGTEKDVEALTEFAMQQHFTPAQRQEARNHILGRMLLSGQVCFLGKVKGEIVNENWIIFDWDYIPQIDSYFVLDKDHSSTRGAYTSEHFRGKGIHPSVKYHMLKFLKELGYHKDYCYADSRNKSSHKGIIRNGYRSMGNLYYVKSKILKRSFFLTNKEIRSFLRTDIT